MNIHLAGIESCLGWKNHNASSYDNFLITFAYFAKTKSKVTLDNQVEKIFSMFSNKNILLDSGAFSKGTGVIDFEIEDYVYFLKKYGNKFFAYINLDVVLLPKKGLNLTDEEIKYSIDQTKINQSVLEKEGLTPIPVYQRLWNNLNVLEELLEKYEYICIGGLAGGVMVPLDIIKSFLDKVFELNSKYKKKLHGLGQTSDWALKRYPFYSVDSTSWLQGTKTCTCYYNDMDEYNPISIDKSNYSKYLIQPELFDNFERDSNYINRLNHNINFYYHYQRVLQELWKYRGKR